MAARLAINQPGDPWEQEADRIAEAVAQPTASLPEATPAAVPGWPDAVLQRQRTTAGAVDQPDAGGAASKATGLPFADVETEGPGAAVVAQQVLHGRHPVGVRHASLYGTAIWPRFPAGAGAHRCCRPGAGPADPRREALTWGPHIIFGAGQYAPTTAEGQHLLAHELVHTIQQASGVTLRTPSPMVLQRQPQPGSPSRTSHYGTDDLPFSAASQIILSQILNEELFGQLAAVQPRVATLQALNTRRATVQIST